MKSVVLTFILVISSNAFASFNEVECEVKTATSELFLEVEQPFPANSVFKRATLTSTDANGVDTSFNYTLTTRGTRGFNTLTYSGAGLNLEVDLWPDQRPQWGRNYRSILRATEVGNSEIRNVNCTFPNAF
jgi:hypothetical protein